MEQIYAMGVVVIEYVQDWFYDQEWYFEIVNTLSNSHHITEILFPIVSAIDSVFGAQLLFCMAFGGWLNCIMKWWLQEDRPYWWVRETTYYSETERPVLHQTTQSCETGPGSPSGHSMAAATTIVLILMWIKHIMHDRCYVWWWKYIMYPASIFAMGSVIVSRLYIATHFPHQCIVGTVIGLFLAPALCIYISDPFIWRYGVHAHFDARRTVSCHVLGSIATAVIGVLVYYSLVLAGIDPQWTIKLAFKWCEYPEYIHVSTTPIFSLVQATGYLLGLALSVTPAIAEYRHYTKHRSIIIAAVTTLGTVYSIDYFLENMCKNNTLKFYATHFVLAAFKPMLLLRVVPAISMWPFERPKAKVE